MRTSLILLVLQTVVSVAMAAPNVDGAKRNAAAALADVNTLNNQIDSVNNQLNPIDAEISEARVKMAGIQAQLQENEADSKGNPWCVGSLCIAGSTLSPDQLVKIGQQRKALQAQLTQINAKINTYEAQARPLTDRVHALTAQRQQAFDKNYNAQTAVSSAQSEANKDAAAARKAANDQRTALNAEVSALKLETKISSLRAATANLQAGMSGIERTFDNTVMGLYMQAKLQDLVDSPQFCEAQKQCSANPSGKRNIKLDSLFKRTADTQKALSAKSAK